MSDPIDISMLPGMTQEVADVLRSLGFHTTSDIVRANRKPLSAVVPGLTIELLRSWQAFAQILEINGIPTAFCSAALSAGIGSLDEFASQSLSRLREILRTVPFEAGSEPKDDDLVEWLKYAVRLTIGGVLNGTVVTADGTPVEGALAQCDGVKAHTDARGRFRHTRLRLGVPLLVEISHPQFGVKRISNVYASPQQAWRGYRFAFPKRPVAPKTLSALRGDRLPRLGTAPLRADAQDCAPEPADILRIVDRYANGDAKAASLFLDFADNAFVVRTYRIPFAELPDGARIMDDLLQTGGKWALTKVTAGHIARQQRLTAARRAGPKSLNDAALERYAEMILSAISD